MAVGFDDDAFGGEDDGTDGLDALKPEIARKRQAAQKPDAAKLKQQDQQMGGMGAGIGGGIGSIWGPVGGAFGSQAGGNLGGDISKVTSGRGGSVVPEYIKGALIPLYHPLSDNALVGPKKDAKEAKGVPAATIGTAYLSQQAKKKPAAPGKTPESASISEMGDWNLPPDDIEWNDETFGRTV